MKTVKSEKKPKKKGNWISVYMGNGSTSDNGRLGDKPNPEVSLYFNPNSCVIVEKNNGKLVQAGGLNLYPNKHVKFFDKIEMFDDEFIFSNKV
jgi:hypothetical protein